MRQLQLIATSFRQIELKTGLFRRGAPGGNMNLRVEIPGGTNAPTLRGFESLRPHSYLSSSTLMVASSSSDFGETLRPSCSRKAFSRATEYRQL